MNLIANFICKHPGCTETYPYYLAGDEPAEAVIIVDYCIMHGNCINIFEDPIYFDIDGVEIKKN